MSHPFDCHYFHGGAKVGGYAGSGYRDFPVHWTTFQRVMKLEPGSVLELGAARGYVLKRLEDAGVRVKGLEISEHCRLTRAIDDLVTWDITKTPWPIADNSFDLCLSVAVLEHIPEAALPGVLAEMARTSRRGLHGVDVHDDDGFDKTHVTIRTLDWWNERLPLGHEAVDKESLESGPVLLPKTTGLKLNLGSFTTMFHGWKNIDQIDLGAWAGSNGYPFMCWDVLRGLPYDDQVVDLVFSSHMLEHLSYEEGATVLAECRRVLRPGGVLRVLVPDAGVLIRKYNEGTLGEFDEISTTSALRTTSAAKLYELLLSGHRAIYDWATLEAALMKAGFVDVARAEFRKSQSSAMQCETFDLLPDLSLIVEARASWQDVPIDDIGPG
jgi:predicted SAM-dependent methyltransferase